ncbi:MAG: hypothetical protein HOQ24_00515, partial [Mycobacteriaceae bacterium]|nr:hypothetical protein [Mycobacteriaceae bacterium]
MMRKIGLASALTAGVVSVTAATASATTAQDSAAAVHFTATPSSNAAVITTDTGSMTADRGVFSIKAPNGAVLAKADLSFRVDDFVFPIVAEIKNRTATLTPRLDLKHAVYQPIAQPDPSQVQLNAAQREQAA